MVSGTFQKVKGRYCFMHINKRHCFKEYVMKNSAKFTRDWEIHRKFTGVRDSISGVFL